MIRRYFATKDNVITNAFEENLVTRGTGSNMGASDVLETFSIYGQANSSSAELARTLIEFDIPNITSDRSSGLIPASGSVSFYLKMYNAPHSQTVPSDFTLSVQGVSGSWQEGYGIDMDLYEDLTKDGIGSNWINANNSFLSASATIKIVNASPTSIDDGTPPSITLTSTDGTERTYKFQNGGSFANAATDTDDESGKTVRWYGVGSTATTQGGIAALLKTAIESSAGHNGKLVVTLSTDSNTDDTLTIKQSTTGFGGNTTIPAVTNGNASDLTINGGIVETSFTGGSGQWATQGGDFYTDNSSSFTQTFSTGLEDLCVDVTTLVEQWIDSAGNVLGSKDNDGFAIKFTNATETGSKSFFTKKFFGRDSEFYFQRPVLEARWDSSRRDDRGSFYLSSSLAPADDNLNTIFLYNRIRGRLRDIPAIGSSNAIRVSLFSGSADNSGPAGSALALSLDIAGNVNSDNRYVVTGSHVATGIYSATFAMTGSPSLTTVYDVWFSGSTAFDHALGLAPNQFTTGSISVKSFSSTGYNPEDTYVLSMPSLRKEYRKDQTHRFNLYVREKNWSPNIHTIAVRSSIPSLTIPSASFQLRRCIDDYVVVPYGTGSTTEPAHTGLSYDVSGNYFDLDTTYLEAGYLYDIQYSFYDEENGWEEQPYRFKFRVVD